MMYDLRYIIASIITVVILFSMVMYDRMLRQELLKWTIQSGYSIIRMERRTLFKGPFQWKSTRMQAIFYVELLDQNYIKRSGWVCCGSAWGLGRSDVQVVWEN